MAFISLIVGITFDIMIVSTALTLMICGIIFANSFNYVLSAGDLAIRIITYIIGFLLTLSCALYLLLIKYSSKKSILVLGIVLILIGIPTIIFVPITSVINTGIIWKTEDIDIDLRIEQEELHHCCYPTGGRNVTDDTYGFIYYQYDFYMNCGAINQSDPDIDWSECKKTDSNGEILCTSTVLHFSQSCGGINNLGTFISFEVIVGLHGIFILLTGIVFIGYYIKKKGFDIHKFDPRNLYNANKSPSPPPAYTANVEQEVDMRPADIYVPPKPIEESTKEPIEEPTQNPNKDVSESKSRGPSSSGSSSSSSSSSRSSSRSSYSTSGSSYSTNS
ncbi:hypothetical protein QTN25_009490 [Entamoeba marina]